MRTSSLVQFVGSFQARSDCLFFARFSARSNRGRRKADAGAQGDRVPAFSTQADWRTGFCDMRLAHFILGRKERELLLYSLD